MIEMTTGRFLILISGLMFGLTFVLLPAIMMLFDRERISKVFGLIWLLIFGTAFAGVLLGGLQ